MEHNVEHPVQPVLDMPAAPHGVGEQLGVERHGRQVAASFQACVAIALDLGFDHRDGAQAWEARLAGEAPGGGEPVHVVADQVASHFDAAMAKRLWMVAGSSRWRLVSLCGLGWLFLTASRWPPPVEDGLGDLGLRPHGAGGASAPLSAKRSSKSGTAVVSLDLASHACWPSTRRWLLAQADTMCSGPRFLPRLWVRREVLPSMASLRVSWLGPPSLKGSKRRRKS